MAEKTVLVVDDSQDLSEVVGEYLGMFGFKVFTANNGPDALEIMAREPVDMVISDIHMPGMDGLSLMAEIKERYAGMPVVLITGYSVSEARKLALGKGADGFVAKPFHMKELRNVVESICIQH